MTVSVVLFSTLAGFAFAKLRFRGRNGLLVAAIATTTVPQQLGIIPLYIMMGELGWTGRLEAVIVPGLVTAFGVFFMTQYLTGAVPDELLEGWPPGTLVSIKTDGDAIRLQREAHE